MSLENKSLHFWALEEMQLLFYDNIEGYRMAVNELKRFNLSEEVEERWMELINLKALSVIILERNDKSEDSAFANLMFRLQTALLKDLESKYSEISSGLVLPVQNVYFEKLEKDDFNKLYKIQQEISVLAEGMLESVYSSNCVDFFKGVNDDMDLSLMNLPLSKRNLYLGLVLREFYIALINSHSEDDRSKLAKFVLETFERDIVSQIDKSKLTMEELLYLKYIQNKKRTPVLNDQNVDASYEMIERFLTYLDSVGLEFSKLFVMAEKITYLMPKHEAVVLFAILANNIVNFDEQLKIVDKNTEEYTHWRNCKLLLDNVRSVLNKGGLNALLKEGDSRKRKKRRKKK
jgi:hypothetical protein